MNDQIKRIDIAEFQAEGYLQELNRRFLHPLGLALEVVDDEETGEVKLGGIWDYRDDPEGIHFGGELDTEKAANIADLLIARAPRREGALGFFIEPVQRPSAPPQPLRPSPMVGETRKANA